MRIHGCVVTSLMFHSLTRTAVPCVYRPAVALPQGPCLEAGPSLDARGCQLNQGAMGRSVSCLHRVGQYNVAPGIKHYRHLE